MKNIEGLIWRTESKTVDDGTNASVSLFLEKACRVIENEINESGGIAGKDLKLAFLRVPKEGDVIDQVCTAVEKLPNILFTHGHIAQGSVQSQEIQQKLNSDSIIYFHGTKSVHAQVFGLSGVDRKPKSIAVSQILGKMEHAPHVIFIHEGKRMAEYEKEFSSDYDGQLTSINFSEFTKEDEIEKKLNAVFPDIDDSTTLILDVRLKVFKPIFDYLNETGKQPLVLKLFGLIQGKFEKIGFPLIEFSSGRGEFPNLDLENLIGSVDVKLNPDEKDRVKSGAWKLDIPLLVAYASRQARCEFSSKEKLLEDLCTALNDIDGTRDIYIGNRSVWAFKENNNIIKENYLFQFPVSLQTPGVFHEILYPDQYFSDQNNFAATKVNYLNIDVLRATNVNIGDGTWNCEFYLDIVSPHDNPLELINFNNLSSVNPKFEAKPIWEEHVHDEEENSRRYYVIANFDFIPLADNYPFDQQHIFISFSISDQNRYGIIQPIPEVLLDRDFQIDGWNLNEATTGVLRKKEVIHKGTNYLKKVEIREEARIGWTLARANSVTVMKIGIPLSFLLFLNYYTLFREFGDIGGSVGILTTAFLSGIALYFSTERPQPLRMTTVDLIFLWYYVLTGVTIVATSVSSLLSEKIFIAAMTGLKIAVPIGVIGIVAFLIRRIKSNRLKPRIN